MVKENHMAIMQHDSQFGGNNNFWILIFHFDPPKKKLLCLECDFTAIYCVALVHAFTQKQKRQMRFPHRRA